jgi:RNA-directed DNA polymerase
MKRHGQFWDDFLAWSNLVRAAWKARRRKRRRPDVLHFEFHREYELLRLQEELRTETWQPGSFRTHWIHRPKPRLISAAPYRDRVVHHAVMNLLEPLLERHFHRDSFACRTDKGTHAAARRLQELLRHFRFTLQGDLRKFFPSVDHEVLKRLFRRRLKDRPFLRLLDRLVDGSNAQEPVCDYFAGDELFAPLQRRKGLPIGNLTSQWFANWYLDPLDHWLTSHYRLGGYVRYCDDFVLLDNDRGKLRDLLTALPQFLDGLRLKLHTERLAILPSRRGRVFVGYRIFPTHRRLKAEGRQRFVRRLRWLRHALAEGTVTAADVHQRIMSWLGHAGQADCLGLIGRLAQQWRFKDGRFQGFRP